MVNKILAATDGSIPAERALEQATVIARACGGALTVVTVMPHGEFPPEMKALARAEHLSEEKPFHAPAIAGVPLWMRDAVAVVASVADDKLAMERLAARILDVAAKQTEAQGVTVETKLLHGDAAASIIQAARDAGADLIVVGHRGLSVLSAMVMGSVSEKIAHEAPCSVLIAK
jgi:nucleotide-binding universal stress UspA family protein